MTRIGVITDAHANLPATLAAISAMEEAGCDLIIHTGDAIGIGPHPREVLELLLDRTGMVLLMGNHDELFAFNQLYDPPAWISSGELEHQRWTHAQLRERWREAVRSWPHTYDLTLGDKRIRFQHYAINDGGFGSISRDNLPGELDAAFCPDTDIVFFGHHHLRADVQGRARYINPGALGTNPGEGARFALIDERPDGSVEVTLHSTPYDGEHVRLAMRERNVPEADFILEVFLEM